MMQLEDPLEPTVFEAVRQYWLFVLIVVAMALGAAFALVTAAPPRFSATASLVVEEPNSSTLFEPGAATRPERYVENQVEILRSAAVNQAAFAEVESEAAALGIDADAFSDAKTVRARASNDVIFVDFEATEAQFAIDAANAVLRAYEGVRRSEAIRSFGTAIDQLEVAIEELSTRLSGIQDEIRAERVRDGVRSELDQQYEDTLEQLAALDLRADPPGADERAALLFRLDAIATTLAIEAQDPAMAALIQEQTETITRLSEFTARREELRVDAELAGAGVVFTSPAEDAESVGLALSRVLPIALVLSLAVAAFGAYLLALRRRRFFSASDPAAILGVPLIASIPDFRAEKVSVLPARYDPASRSAEAFRFVVAVTRPKLGSDTKVIMFVSSDTGDGKTVTAANTALAFARSGLNVLVFDADFGSQALAELLVGPEAKGRRGITNSWRPKDATLPGVDSLSAGGSATFDLIGRGTHEVDAPDFFASSDFESRFAVLREKYDVIIVDGPPVLRVAYATLLARRADALIAVIPHGSSVADAFELDQRLRQLGTSVVGYTYTKAPLPRTPSRVVGSMADVLGGGNSHQKGEGEATTGEVEQSVSPK